MTRTNQTRAAALTIAVIAALAVACLPATTAQTAPALSGDPVPALAALPIRPEDTTAVYERDQWGDWATHGDGCDTRELVLTDQGTGTTPGPDCRPVCPDAPVGPACWVGPYDGAELRDPSRVHIDHRVPLAEAARSGAAGWTGRQREQFYNDTNNLVAASAESNTSKGDDDPGRWQPPNRAVWCDYATRYVTTKDTYGLSVDPAERAALAEMLATCDRRTS
ncbi:HNH endonuclease family protein [Actinophytocola sediminis]